jgi:hypothetical protein
MLGGLSSCQIGISVGARRPKQPQAKTGPTTGPLTQSDLTLVPSNLQGMSVARMAMGIAHLLGVL